MHTTGVTTTEGRHRESVSVSAIATSALVMTTAAETRSSHVIAPQPLVSLPSLAAAVAPAPAPAPKRAVPCRRHTMPCRWRPLLHLPDAPVPRSSLLIALFTVPSAMARCGSEAVYPVTQKNITQNEREMASVLQRGGEYSAELSGAELWSGIAVLSCRSECLPCAA